MYISYAFIYSATFLQATFRLATSDTAVSVTCLLLSMYARKPSFCYLPFSKQYPPTTCAFPLQILYLSSCDLEGVFGFSSTMSNSLAVGRFCPGTAPHSCVCNHVYLSETDLCPAVPYGATVVTMEQADWLFQRLAAEIRLLI